jgi:hypothetical protein
MGQRANKRFAGTSGVPPAMSATREKWIAGLLWKTARLRRVCGRDARGPSKSLDGL